MPPQGPIYDWIATYPDGEKICLAPSAYAYADFLKRLTWTALHQPDTDAFAKTRFLYLEDEDGLIDTLALGATNQNGHYLRFHTTGMTVPLIHGELFLPSKVAVARTSLPGSTWR